MSAPLRRVLIAVAAVAAMVLTIRLGMWQLSRADEKQALQTTVDARGAMEPLTLAALRAAGTPQDLLYRRVHVHGRWLPASTVYLENRPMNARVGFFVVTVLQPDASGPALAVVRGWAPRNFQERTALPAVTTPSGEVEVHGQLVPSPSRLYEFGPSEKGPIRQNLDLEAYATEAGTPLLELAVRQQGEASEGLLREWARSDFGVDKHLGYAFQWFALAGLIATLYLWFQIVRPYQARRRKPQP